MPEFLAETYAPRDAPGGAASRAAGIALGAGQASQHGMPVRFLGAILVPDEETCFWLYQAPSAAAVRLAMIRARLRPERITPAVLAGPLEADPDPASRIGSTTRPPAPSPDPAAISLHPRQRTSPAAAGTGPPSRSGESVPSVPEPGSPS